MWTVPSSACWRSKSCLTRIHYAVATTEHTAVLITVCKSVKLVCSCEYMQACSCVDNWLTTNRLSLNVSKTSYMIISSQKNSLDIKIWETILTKISTVKFLGVTLDENLIFKDNVNKVTSNISKCMCWYHEETPCQLPANVIVKLYYSLVYIPIWLMLYWHGEDREVQMLLRLSALTGEHVNYSQIITRSSLFTQFMIPLLY